MYGESAGLALQLTAQLHRDAAGTRQGTALWPYLGPHTDERVSQITLTRPYNRFINQPHNILKYPQISEKIF